MLYTSKQEDMRIMSKDIETLKERIISWIDEKDKPYVVPLLNDLENAIHEHSFESGYETGYDIGWFSGVEQVNERRGYRD